MKGSEIRSAKFHQEELKINTVIIMKYRNGSSELKIQQKMK